jgi:flagellar basal-body rod protein FlgF
MSKGIYAAASAMVAETRSLEVTARNVAHAQTPGYRREQALRGSFAEALAAEGRTGAVTRDGGAGVTPAGSWFGFAQGQIQDTGATFDFALTGDGFFRVRDPGGQEWLTRAGRFVPDASGRLVTPEGWSLIGQGGPITIPADAERIAVDPSGRITATQTIGGVVTDTVIDQVRTAAVDDPARMTARNGVFFDPADQDVRDGTALIRQGAIETANVEPVRELVDLIALQRRYDAAQRAMSEQARAGDGFSDLLRGA